MPDEPDYSAEIRRIVAADAAVFLQQSLEGDETGIPPPPVIDITEVSVDPIKFDVLEFGKQGAETTPSGHGGITPPPPPTASCTFSATLHCDQTSGGANKCGFATYQTTDPPKMYRTQTTTGHRTRTGGACKSSVWAGYHCSFDLYYTRVEQYGPHCETYTDTDSPPGGIFTLTDCHGDPITTGVSWCSPTATSPTNKHCEVINQLVGGQAGCVGEVSHDSQFYDMDLSDEYTTAMLISDAQATLPAYDNDFNDTCYAYRFLDDTELSYDFARFKYYWTFPSPATTCKFCWRERFTPDDTGVPEDFEKCVTVKPGMTKTAVFEVFEPNVNGNVEIV